jgi:C4-dicarboxylate transporter DctM subunit
LALFRRKIFRKLLTGFEDISAAVFITAMSFIVLYGVILRYVGAEYPELIQSIPILALLFSLPMAWTEELSRFLFVWGSFLGSAIAIRQHGHFGIDLLIKKFNPRLRKWIFVLHAVAIWGFLAILFYYGWLQVQRTHLQLSPAMRIPMSYVYFIMPLACLFMIIELIFFTYNLWHICASEYAGTKESQSDKGITTLLWFLGIVLAANLLICFGWQISLPVVLLISAVVSATLGIPIAFSIGIGTTLALINGNFALTEIPRKFFYGMDMFSLLAIPLFIMAGGLMEVGGISIRLVQLARVLVGWIPGGMGLVTVVSTILFSGVSGASTADTAAIGSIMIPAMEKRGYSREQATAIVAASGGMGILIPPCISMVILGVVAEKSIGTLFMGGFVPGITMGITLMGMLFYQAQKKGIPREPVPNPVQVIKAFLDSIIPLLMPVIIMGGILLGWFTATEAAVVAVVYGLIVGVFIYREIKLHNLWNVLLNTASITGSIAVLVGSASVLSYIMANEQIPQGIAEWILNFSKDPRVFLLLANILFLFIGSILEGAPAIILLIPLLLPSAEKLGLDPIHFSIMTIANLGVGFILPPTGLCLLVACGVGKVSIAGVSRPLIPYLIIMILTTFILIAYIPWLATILPSLFMRYIPVGPGQLFFMK